MGRLGGSDLGLQGQLADALGILDVQELLGVRQVYADQLGAEVQYLPPLHEGNEGQAEDQDPQDSGEPQEGLG